MAKHKLDNETKRMIRSVSIALPNYYEPYIQKKIIHHKDIETNDMLKEGEELNKDSSYTANFRDGKRLVDSKLHYKRMCNAWKEGGQEGYRAYLIEFNKKEFKHASLWNRFLSKLNMN